MLDRGGKSRLIILVNSLAFNAHCFTQHFQHLPNFGHSGTTITVFALSIFFSFKLKCILNRNFMYLLKSGLI